MPLTRRVYMCVRVCTIFDAERRGRTCSGMFCRVCSIEIFLGNFVNFCTFSVREREVIEVDIWRKNISSTRKMKMPTE